MTCQNSMLQTLGTEFHGEPFAKNHSHLGRVEDKGVSGVHEVKERVIEPGVLI